jgi:hypothetical protein
MFKKKNHELFALYTGKSENPETIEFVNPLPLNPNQYILIKGQQPRRGEKWVITHLRTSSFVLIKTIRWYHHLWSALNFSLAVLLQFRKIAKAAKAEAKRHREDANY